MSPRPLTAHHARPRWRAGAAAALLVAFAAFTAPAAHAQSGAMTFGPNLAAITPSNQEPCDVDPFPFLGEYEPTGAQSCSWTSTDPTNSLGGQLPPGGDGTISQVSIKVGAQTGPMEVVIMQAEFMLVGAGTAGVHYNISCCTDAGRTAPFTPTANAISTEPVNLPVEVDTTANPDNGLQTVDFVGLSVLAPNVPVPAVDDTGLAVLDQPGTDVEEPALLTSQQTQLADADTGYLVAMDSTWVPQAGSSPTPTPSVMSSPPPATTHTMTTPPTTQSVMPTAPAPVPTLTFPTAATLARVSGQDALLRLGCSAGGATCEGNVAVQSAEAPGGATTASAAKAKPKKAKPKKSKPKLVTYATGSFDIAAGHSGSVKAKLSSAGRTAAHGHRRVKVWINVTLAGTSPAKVVSHQVTLRF